MNDLIAIAISVRISKVEALLAPLNVMNPGPATLYRRHVQVEHGLMSDLRRRLVTRILLKISKEHVGNKEAYLIDDPVLSSGIIRCPVAVKTSRIVQGTEIT